YPAPIFMDKQNNAYFNVLNNYLETKSYRSKWPYYNKDICLKQLYKNCMLEWNCNIPKLRNINNENYKQWKKKNNFYDNKKYILIFPDEFKSFHDEDWLGWDDRQLRELAEMVRHLGITVVSCAKKRIDPYYRAGEIVRAPLDLDIITNLILNSFGVLSKDIDFLIMSMMISDSTIIMSKDIGGIYDLYDHADFLQSKNMIFTENNLLP